MARMIKALSSLVKSTSLTTVRADQGNKCHKTETLVSLGEIGSIGRQIQGLDKGLLF